MKKDRVNIQLELDLSVVHLKASELRVEIGRFER